MAQEPSLVCLFPGRPFPPPRLFNWWDSMCPNSSLKLLLQMGATVSRAGGQEPFWDAHWGLISRWLQLVLTLSTRPCWEVLDGEVESKKMGGIFRGVFWGPECGPRERGVGVAGKTPEFSCKIQTRGNHQPSCLLGVWSSLRANDKAKGNQKTGSFLEGRE